MNYAIIVLIAYAGVMLLATVLITKKERDVSRFCVGNRNAGWAITALSEAATSICNPQSPAA